MPDRRLTFMAVHAHPDDEATGTGGVFAKYAAEGIETVLVTCTDGACGDGPGGVKPGEPGHVPAEVVAMREVELANSAAILGITHVELLRYADSGMMGWAMNDAPGSFWSTPVGKAAERLAALMVKYQPDVVVTYDPYGFYGHPDHIQAHRVTMAALEISGVGSKVYWTTAPRSMFDELGALMRELGEDWDEPETEGQPAISEVEIGLPDEEISAWVDTTEYGDQKFDSLAAHASQGESIAFLRMGKERFIHFMGVETFVRVRDSTGAPLPEDDLFAGLR